MSNVDEKKTVKVICWTCAYQGNAEWVKRESMPSAGEFAVFPEHTPKGETEPCPVSGTRVPRDREGHHVA